MHHRNFHKQTPFGMSIGAGLGVGLVGALALALRFGWRHPFTQQQIPDAISPAVFATRVLNTSSGEIVYHTAGTPGEAPLLFLHGVFPGASSFEWSKVYPVFAAQHHVLVPDLIGFGESQRPNPAITPMAHVHALAQFLDTTTGGHPVTIIASGLSANLALLLGAYHPTKVARLLLWMPLLAIKKIPSLAFAQQLMWVPSLARIAYRRYFSTETTIKEWLLNSGFSEKDSTLLEATHVLTSTAQQYGSEHAFLTQNTARFWRGLRLSPIEAPVMLLVHQGVDSLAEQTLLDLRPFVSRFTITDVETTSLLAPLIEPLLIVEAITKNLGNI